MAKKLYDEEDIRGIARAIRTKNKSQNTYRVDQMEQAVLDIETSKPQQSKTVSPSTSQQTVTADEGYELASVQVNAMPDGALNLGFNTSTGLISASVSTAGYVDSGDNKTQQLTVQAGKTITPSTSNQTAVAASRWTTGAVTVAGDANLKPENIRKGTSIFNKQGTLEPLEISNGWPEPYCTESGSVASGLFIQRVLQQRSENTTMLDSMAIGNNIGSWRIDSTHFFIIQQQPSENFQLVLKLIKVTGETITEIKSTGINGSSYLFSYEGRDIIKLTDSTYILVCGDYNGTSSQIRMFVVTYTTDNFTLSSMQSFTLGNASNPIINGYKVADNRFVVAANQYIGLYTVNGTTITNNANVLISTTTAIYKQGVQIINGPNGKLIVITSEKLNSGDTYPCLFARTITISGNTITLSARTQISEAGWPYGYAAGFANGVIGVVASLFTSGSASRVLCARYTEGQTTATYASAYTNGSSGSKTYNFNLEVDKYGNFMAGFKQSSTQNQLTFFRMTSANQIQLWNKVDIYSGSSEIQPFSMGTRTRQGIFVPLTDSKFVVGGSYIDTSTGSTRYRAKMTIVRRSVKASAGTTNGVTGATLGKDTEGICYTV